VEKVIGQKQLDRLKKNDLGVDQANSGREKRGKNRMAFRERQPHIHNQQPEFSTETDFTSTKGTENEKQFIPLARCCLPRR